MFAFLETDIRERQKHKKRIQTSVDNTVNDQRYEIKFENCVRDKTFLLSRTFLFFLKQKYILFLATYFFKILKHLIASAFVLLRQILKNTDMPWQKPRHLPIVTANFECCSGIFIAELTCCSRVFFLLTLIMLMADGILIALI